MSVHTEHFDLQMTCTYMHTEYQHTHSSYFCKCTDILRHMYAEIMWKIAHCVFVLNLYLNIL